MTGKRERITGYSCWVLVGVLALACAESNPPAPATEGAVKSATGKTGFTKKSEEAQPPSAGSPEVSQPPPARFNRQLAEKGMGELSVQTRPWSRVSIDGKYIKNTPIVRYPLKAGDHTVTLENPQFNIKLDYQVTIIPGERSSLVTYLL